MQSKYLIIVNKASNNGMTRKKWPRIKDELNHYHINYIATASRYSQNIRLITSEYIKKATHNDILMVIGGDGTLNRVINSSKRMISQTPNLPTLPIAYLPTGKKNTFARIHHISLNYLKDLKQIIFNGRVFPIKIGYFNETIKKDRKYFMNNNEIGFNFTPIKTMAQSKFHWYFFKEWWSIIKSLYDVQSFPLSMYLNGKTKTIKRVLQINVTTYPGLHSKYPYFTLIIIKKHNLFIMLYVTLLFYLKKHPKSKFINYLKFPSVHLGIPTLEYSRIDNENIGSRFYDLYYHWSQYPFII